MAYFFSILFGGFLGLRLFGVEKVPVARACFRYPTGIFLTHSIVKLTQWISPVLMLSEILKMVLRNLLHPLDGLTTPTPRGVVHFFFGF